ncbi:proton-coupled zinc antiporter SLC30A2-like isoform X2 [Ptychodera flava]|uniref:proton-coupled zinc antiporter SLC30A2-like isoform X2 n=1 Tax=Ptychodera flava TaxID=63121 RepID=UPI00396A783E
MEENYPNSRTVYLSRVVSFGGKSYSKWKTRRFSSPELLRGDEMSYGTIDDEPGSDDHCHRKNGVFKVDKKARRKLIMASVLCLAFMVGEVIGGYFSGSLAIMTDAAHMLTDFASFLISLFSLWVASRPPTKRMNFGWHRAEILGALVSVILIWLVTGVLVYLAIHRVIAKDYEIGADIMLITAGCGVAVNLIIGITLHDCGHGHTHGSTFPAHSHSHEDGSGHREQNVNVRAALIHVLGDILQSVGVLTAAVIIYFKPEYAIADPICTFIFSAIVLSTTVSILKDAIVVLMEATPKGFDFTEVQSTLSEIDGVKSIHSLHIWSLTMGRNALAVHLAIESPTEGKEVDPQSVLSEAARILEARYNLHDTTIQIENYSEGMETCSQCRAPLD